MARYRRPCPAPPTGLLVPFARRSAPPALLTLIAFLGSLFAPIASQAATLAANVDRGTPPLPPTTTTSEVGDNARASMTDPGPRGNGSHSISLSLIRARGAVQPSGTLVYNSESTHSPFGYGWTIPLLSVRRESSLAVSPTNTPDRIVFKLGDGRKLVSICRIASTEGCAPNERAPNEPEPPFLPAVVGWQYFRPEKGDHSERYFLSLPLQDQMLVEHADGTIHELGRPLNLPVDRSGDGDEEWFRQFGPGVRNAAYSGTYPQELYVSRSYGREAVDLTQVILKPRNHVRYFYRRVGGRRGRGGVLLLTDIYDSPLFGSEGFDPGEYAHHTRFVLEGQASVPNGLYVSRIDITSNPVPHRSSRRELVRRWHLEQTPGLVDPSKRFLRSIQMEGRCRTAPEKDDGSLPVSSCPRLAATTFGYSESAITLSRAELFPVQSPVPPSEKLFGLNLEVADFDGNGRPDVLDTSADKVVFHLQGLDDDASGAFTRVEPPSPIPEDIIRPVPVLKNPVVLVGDFDGDGRADLLTSPQGFDPEYDGTDYIYSLTTLGEGRYGWREQTAKRRGAASRVDRSWRPFAVADVNGDGRHDILTNEDSEVDQFLIAFSYPPLPGSNNLRLGYERCLGPDDDTCFSRDGNVVRMPRDTSDEGDPAIRIGRRGVRLADVDGDRKADLVRVKPGRVVYWPGDGDGRFGDPTSGPSADSDGMMELTGSHPWPEVGEGLFVTDVTFDGFADLLAVQDGKLTVLRNLSGSLLEVIGTADIPGACGDDVRLLQSPDRTTVLARNCTTGELYKVDIMRTGRPDLLEQVDDGAVLTSYTYEKRELKYWVMVPTKTGQRRRRAKADVIWVLTSRTERNPIGLPFPSGGTSRAAEYSYEMPATNQDARFIGYSRVTARHKGDTNAKDLIATTRYFFGSCRSDGPAVDPAQECVNGGERTELDKLPAERRIEDGAGHVREVTVFGYEVQERFGGRVLAVGQASSDRYVYSGRDVPGSSSDVLVEDFRRDGEVYSRRVKLPDGYEARLRQTYGRGAWFQLETLTNYGRVGTDPVITEITKRVPQKGFVFRTVETRVEPGDLKHQEFEYDDNARPIAAYRTLHGTQPLRRFHEIAGLNVAPPPENAEPEGKHVWQYFAWDSWGNLNGIQAADGSCTNTEYDSSGRYALYSQVASDRKRYPEEFFCPLENSLITFTSYDQVSGAVNSVTGPAEDRARSEFDPFGRPTKIWGSSATSLGELAPTPLATIEYFDPTPSRRYSAVKTTKRSGDGTRTEWVYTDGFGQELLRLTEADPGAGDAGNYVAEGLSVRDAHGRIIAANRPWFVTLTPEPTAPVFLSPEGLATTIERDAFGRQIRTTWPDGTTRSQTIHYAFRQETYDGDAAAGAQGAPTITNLDGHGRVTSTERPTSDRGVRATLVTKYSYHPTGGITRIERVKKGGVEPPWVRWMAYDSFGRRVLNVEPSATMPFTPEAPATVDGLATVPGWRYAYDAHGQLVGTSDPRGCGENRFYDNANRLRGIDYSPCLDHHALYSPPDLETGDGVEAFYVYDIVPPSLAALFGLDPSQTKYPGKLVATADRAQATVLLLDARGRTVEQRTRVAPPGYAQDGIDRYASHVFTKTFAYDESDRLLRESTGAEQRGLLNEEGQSFVRYEYSKRGLVRSIDSSHGLLVSEVDRDAQGRAVRTVYGDAGATTTLVGFDARDMLARLQTRRASLPASAAPASPVEPTRQLVLEDVEVPAYDLRGNPRAIQDKRDPKAWPKGAKPVSRAYAYDAESRVTSVDYSYGDSDASWVSPYTAERSMDPSSTIGKPARDEDEAGRPAREAIQYDVRGNVLSRNVDGSFFTRALPNIRLNQGTDQLAGATGAAATGGSESPGATASYDAAGNLVTLTVRAEARTTGAGTAEEQELRLRWDEAGRLARVERRDGAVRADSDETVPADLVEEYGYDGANGRVRKSKTDASGRTRHDLYIFSSLEERGVTFASASNTYQLTETSEVALLGGVGRAFVTERPLLGAPGRRTHVFLTLRDHLGSSRIVLDRGTGEVVEAMSMTAFGATESDYRPERWAAFREDYRFTGKEEDVEVGLVYFGHRYYSASLGRFISPDPLAIHALGADLNPYAYVRGQLSTATDPNGLMDDKAPACLLEDAFAGACMVPGSHPDGWGAGASGPAGERWDDEIVCDNSGSYGVASADVAVSCGWRVSSWDRPLRSSFWRQQMEKLEYAGQLLSDGLDDLSKAAFIAGLVTAAAGLAAEGGAGGAALAVAGGGAVAVSTPVLVTAGLVVAAVGAAGMLVVLMTNGNPRQPGPTRDPITGEEVGRFVVDSNGNTMIEPVGGSTEPAGPGGVDTHTTYPNGSNYQRLNPKGHANNPTPHAHGHAPGTGPKMRGQGPSLAPDGRQVPWNSPDAHWPIK